jgi:hypothetical protein
MIKRVYVGVYHNGKHEVLVHHADNHELATVMYYHCYDSIADKGKFLNASKKNMELLKGVLDAHGFEVSYIKTT